MKNVVVTGGNGFVGSNLVRKLLLYGYKVAIIEKIGNSITELQDISDEIDIHYYDGNIQKLIEFFREQGKVDLVFHLASLVKTSHKSEDITDLINSNILFGTHLLEAMHKTGCYKMINTSTYWQHYNNEIYNPVDLYAATKEAYEKIIKFYVEVDKFNVITLELFDNYGKNDKRRKIMNLLKEIYFSNEVLHTTLGEQYIDLLYIDDLTEAYLVASKLLNGRKKYLKYSLRSKKIYTLREVIEKFIEITGKKLNIRFGELEYKEREIMVPWDKGEELPGWSAKYTLDEGIKKFMDL